MTTDRTYSVSVMVCRGDNGFALSFTSREAAEECRRQLIEQCCHYVSAIW